MLLVGPRLRRWFGSTGAEPWWPLVACLAVGFVAGYTLGAIVGERPGAILAGITGAVVAAFGASGPLRTALSMAVIAAGVGSVFVIAAFVSAGHPWWAAASMAFVAMATSLAAGTGVAGAQVGLLCSVGYVLAVMLTTILDLAVDVSAWSGALHAVLGAAAGLAVTAVGASLRIRRDRESAQNAQVVPARWARMWTSLRSFDEHARDGLRRAIPLAVGMFLYQHSPTRDALWIFLAAFAVLVPTGKSAPAVAATSVASTLLGVAALGPVTTLLPNWGLFAASIVLLILGVAYQPTYPVLSGAASAAGAVLLVGAPAAAVGTWAGHRLLDTLVGCALALVPMYLLWPRDPVEDKLPASS